MYHRYRLLGEVLARSILNGLPLGINISEYIPNYIQRGKKDVLKGLETRDKQLFNSINSISPEVTFRQNF